MLKLEYVDNGKNHIADRPLTLITNTLIRVVFICGSKRDLFVNYLFKFKLRSVSWRAFMLLNDTNEHDVHLAMQDQLILEEGCCCNNAKHGRAYRHDGVFPSRSCFPLCLHSYSSSTGSSS